MILSANSGAIDCVPYVDAALQNSGALADDDETRIGMFLQHQRRRFDQFELTFVRTNHPHVADQRRVITDADFTAEFCPIARRLELFQIDGGTDDFNFCGINSVLFHQLAFDHRSVGNDLRTAVLENECATSAADWIGDAARAAQWNSKKEKWQTNPVIL